MSMNTEQDEKRYTVNVGSGKIHHLNDENDSTNDFA